jgi:hypothetical protein
MPLVMLPCVHALCSCCPALALLARPPPLALAAHGHRPGPPGQPLLPRPDPFTCAHLPGPKEKVGDGTPGPPIGECPVRKFFLKINPDKNREYSYPPRQRDPERKIQT